MKDTFFSSIKDLWGCRKNNNINSKLGYTDYEFRYKSNSNIFHFCFFFYLKKLANNISKTKLLFVHL